MTKTNKIQFNATSAKAFRATIAKAEDAFTKIDDSIAFKTQRVSNLNGLIATNEAMIEEVDGVRKVKSTCTYTLEKLDEQIAGWRADIDRENEQLKKLKDRYDKVTEEAYAIFRDDNETDLYTLYTRYITTHMSAESTKNYADGIARIFVKNGLTDANADNCDEFTRVVGKKKIVGKKAIKAKKHTSEVKSKEWIELFTRDLCDYLVDNGYINKSKYEFVLDENK